MIKKGDKKISRMFKKEKSSQKIQLFYKLMLTSILFLIKILSKVQTNHLVTFDLTFQNNHSFIFRYLDKKALSL